MKKFTALSLSLFVLLGAAACKRNDIVSKPVRQKPDVIPITPSQNVQEAAPFHSCPNIDEVCKSRADCENLIQEANQILKNQLPGSQRVIGSKSLTTQLLAWREEFADWKKFNQTLIDSCFLLLGADGTQVHPEIPASLKDLSLAGIWLNTSVDLLEAGDKEASSLYLTKASASSRRAHNRLDDKLSANPRRALRTIPKHVSIPPPP